MDKEGKISQILQDTISRHPQLEDSEDDILQAYIVMKLCYQRDGKMLICGNGGSAADAEHIVGELMKSFDYERQLPETLKDKLKEVCPDDGMRIADKLQPALRAISLCSHPALNTAFANDVDPELIFAQQVVGYGQEGDTFLGISTSGNSKNVVSAAITARAKGLQTIGLTGKGKGQLDKYCDVVIGVNGSSVSDIQELHLPVYHALCKMLEIEFFA